MAGHMSARLSWIGSTSVVLRRWWESTAVANQYLQQVAPDHAPPGIQIRVGCLSATSPQCQTLVGFVRKALEVLQWHPQQLNPSEASLERLAIEVCKMGNQKIIPVLCIDEFAYWMGNSDFDSKFLAGLRAIAEDQENGLVLIIASRYPLHAVIEQRMGASSPLFNIMQELDLSSFNEAEAKEFIDKKGQQSGLSVDEKLFFLDCASIRRAKGKKDWPPLRLQLAGCLLLKDKYEPAQSSYDLNDLAYRKTFKKRLDKQYWAMVKHL